MKHNTESWLSLGLFSLILLLICLIVKPINTSMDLFTFMLLIITLLTVELNYLSRPEPEPDEI